MAIGNRERPMRRGGMFWFVCLGPVLIAAQGCALHAHAPAAGAASCEAIATRDAETPAGRIVRTPSVDDRLPPGRAELHLTADSSAQPDAPVHAAEVGDGFDVPAAMPEFAGRAADPEAGAAGRSRGADAVEAARAQSEVEKLRALAEAAVQRYASMQSYACTLHRRERIGGELSPPETLRFQFRKEPWSVYLRWTGQEHRGREIVYVRGRYDDKIHGREPVLFGRIPLKLDPFGPMVLRNARYPITEAGIGNVLEKFAQAVAELEEGTLVGQVQYLGPLARPEAPHALYGVRHVLPDGTRRDIYFDPEIDLPVLIEAVDRNGALLEYYHYSQIEPNLPELESPHAFDPGRVFS